MVISVSDREDHVLEVSGASGRDVEENGSDAALLHVGAGGAFG